MKTQLSDEEAINTEESWGRPRDTGLNSAMPARVQFLMHTQRNTCVHVQACEYTYIPCPLGSRAGKSQQRLECPVGPEGKSPENSGGELRRHSAA